MTKRSIQRPDLTGALLGSSAVSERRIQLDNTIAYLDRAIALAETMRKVEQTGYTPCGCRDCFETAIGKPGEFCHDCKTAGCEPDSECQSPSAYGGTK